MDNFVSDQNALLDFGQSAVEEVNGTVNRILAEQKNYKFPQVDELLKTPTKNSMALVAKYKDAQVAELDKSLIPEKLFKQSKNTLQEFYFDSQNIGQKMDGMAATVVKQEDVPSSQYCFCWNADWGWIPNQLKPSWSYFSIEAAQQESGNRALKLQLKPAQARYDNRWLSS